MTLPDVLRGLAANTGLGLEVLEPLLGSLDQATLVVLAKRADLTGAAVTSLARQSNPAVRAVLAHNAVAAVTAWPLLVGDTDVDVRRALARGHSKDFRPAIDLPLPEEAQWRLARDADARVRQELASRRDLAVPVGLHLASDPEASVRRAIASWSSLPDSVVPALLLDVDPQVRRGVLHWATIPVELQADLLADPETRAAAAAWVRLDRDGVAELLSDSDVDVRLALAGNPHVPYVWVLPLADEYAFDDDVDAYEEVRATFMLRRDLPDDVRERVAATVPPQDYHLAWWLSPQQATLEQRLAYVTSRFVFFRRAVAMSPDLPAWAVARLAADDDWSVRILLAENHPDAPGDMIPDLIRAGGHAGWELVKHRTMPVDALTEFACSDDLRLRRIAATGPNLPAAIAIELTDHHDLETRQLVAANPALPLPKVINLLTDPSVAEAAASNPRLPPNLARTLIADRAVAQ